MAFSALTKVSVHPAGPVTCREIFQGSLIVLNQTSVCLHHLAGMEPKIVDVLPERVSNVSSNEYPHQVPGKSFAWDTEAFKANLRVDVTRLTNEHAEFDVVGVDASLANAIRRTLIAEVSRTRVYSGLTRPEVPTVAIEHVYIWNNTSIIQDEVLSHRLGLIPLAVDPSKLSFKMDEDANDQNTVVFTLKAECKKKAKDVVTGRYVYSSQLEWEPKGDQAEMMADAPPKPVSPSIVIAKLAPGQVRCSLQTAMLTHFRKWKWSCTVRKASGKTMPSFRLWQPLPIAFFPTLIS